MKIAVETINHVGLDVKDLAVSDRFYAETLGFPRHHVRPNWFVLNAASTLHLIPLADVAAVEPAHHAYRHVALQVADLQETLRALLAAGMRVMTIAFNDGEREITSVDDPLNFGVGTLLVRDPDENLIEFLQVGQGLFTAEMQPRITQ